MNLVNFFLEILFPPRCIFCDRIISQNKKICGMCNAYKYTIGNNICVKCGRDIENCLCKGNELFFERCIAPFYFSDVIRDSIHKFKFKENQHKTKVFANFMYECILEKYSDISFDYIIPVPMYPKKQRKRGYNQSELLGINLSKMMNVPYSLSTLVKVKDMTAQHELQGINRFENIADTFGIINPEIIDNKNILVVDDVLTSGSTLSECAKTLKQNGANRIYGIVIAATLK